MNKTIGFIGCGNMAGAIIGGLVSSGKVKGENIIASDGFPKGLDNCKDKYGIRTSLNDNLTVAREADILFLAVKPNVYFKVIDEIKNEVKENVIIWFITSIYIYMFLEAMGDGGVLAGIPRDKAYKMSAQAMIGSAKMLLETGKHPGELKDMVCSPAGTTIEAVYSLEKNNFRGTIIEAMEKCTEKSNEMAGKNNFLK